MARHIKVRSTIPTKADGGNVVALYEAHADHPDGEAFVAGPEPVDVARTPQVHRLLSEGTLEQVGGRKADDDAEDAPAAGAPVDAAPARARGRAEG